MRLLGPLVCALLLCAAAGVTPPKRGSPAKAPSPPPAGGATSAATQSSAALAKQIQKEVEDFRASFAKAAARLKVDMDALAAASKDAATAKDMALYRTKCKPAGSKAPKITAKEQAACKEIETKRKALIAATLKIRGDLPKPSARVSDELRWSALLGDTESSTNTSASTQSSSGSMSRAKAPSSASKIAPPKQKSKPIPSKKQTRPALLEVGAGIGTPRKPQQDRFDVTRLPRIEREDGSPTDGRVIPWTSHGGLFSPVIQEKLDWFTHTIGADCIRFQYLDPGAAEQAVIVFNTAAAEPGAIYDPQAQRAIISCDGAILGDNRSFAALLMEALGFVPPSRRSDATQHIKVRLNVDDPWYRDLPRKKRTGLARLLLPDPNAKRVTVDEPSDIPYDTVSVMHPPSSFQGRTVWVPQNVHAFPITPIASDDNRLALSPGDIRSVRELYCTPAGPLKKAG